MLVSPGIQSIHALIQRAGGVRRIAAQLAQGRLGQVRQIAVHPLGNVVGHRNHAQTEAGNQQHHAPVQRAVAKHQSESRLSR